MVPLVFAAENTTACPVVTVSLTNRLAVVLSVAVLLVAEPAVFVATTEYAPASLAATLAIVYEVLVALPIFTPPFCHW
jgi:hypothetical protein